MGRVQLEINGPTSPTLCGDFDLELEILCACMATKVVNVLEPFLSFTCALQSTKVHNIFVLMLDL